MGDLDNYLRFLSNFAQSGVTKQRFGSIAPISNSVAAEKQLPFELKVPNTETRAAMKKADKIVRTRRARFKNAVELFDDLEKNNS